MLLKYQDPDKVRGYDELTAIMLTASYNFHHSNKFNNTMTASFVANTDKLTFCDIMIFLLFQKC